jgi:hypothetical protein
MEALDLLSLDRVSREIWNLIWKVWDSETKQAVIPMSSLNLYTDEQIRNRAYSNLFEITKTISHSHSVYTFRIKEKEKKQAEPKPSKAKKNLEVSSN